MSVAAIAPVECSLVPGALRERIDLIGKLNREALKTRLRTGPRLELGYDPAAEARVRSLVKRERECCGFLQFEVRSEDALVVLAITAPDDEMADAVLSPFENGADVVGASRSKGAAVATAAATSATAAVACGACCVLPLAVPAVAMGTLGGALSWFAGARVWMVGLAAVAVAVAWAWVAWDSRRTSRRPARSTVAIIVAATAMLALAIAWPHLEAGIVRIIRT